MYDTDLTVPHEQAGKGKYDCIHEQNAQQSEIQQEI